MSNIVVDDTNSNLTYTGQWTLYANGSSRQWNSTVHSTFQAGATVSFQFQGTPLLIFDVSYLIFFCRHYRIGLPGLWNGTSGQW